MLIVRFRHCKPNLLSVRRLSTGPETEVYISRSNSPYFNLSFESYLFSRFPLDVNRRTLFLYTNSPCIVIGRNQNPYRELTSLSALRRHQLPLIRRRSGGGTVFHDTGNLNFCVMMPNSDFDRDVHALMICNAVNNDLSSLGKKLVVNQRHDIVDETGKKVSGSAYKLERGKAYHHGTMLLNSQLSYISSMLHDPNQIREDSWQTVDGPGVESVKSPVANVGLNMDLFISRLVSEFKRVYSSEHDGKNVRFVDENTLSDEENAAIEKGCTQLKTWKWTFGMSPKYTHNFFLSPPSPSTAAAVSFFIRDGIVADFNSLNPLLASRKNDIIGCWYRWSDLEPYIISDYWRQRLSRCI
ncbi:uncharacterized protein V1516DRAFT_675395 [Lipomyces oligophaga]|uniref:uncharacterized protein n=1 Tax=Lipomyces oligophaga TaxID=45792 RepID=UPI0034D02094